MSSIPAGNRNWKCPECGGEVLLSITQLDPIACDACVVKMKGAAPSGGFSGVADTVSGPMRVWSSFNETTKLSTVIAALVLGLTIGFFAGKSSIPQTKSESRGHHRNSEMAPTDEKSFTEDGASEDAVELRPSRPGPGYKWVSGRKRKDGTRGDGHWAKDPHAKSDQ